MPEINSKPKVLLSDPAALHKIKFIQFRMQLFPLIAVVVFMVINIFFPHKIVLYLTIASFGWYLAERILFRTKNKILVPEEGTFVSPVEGKIVSIRKGPDSTLITIKKSFLDVVELRLPFPDLQTEIADNWHFDTPAGQVNIRIKARKVAHFENHNIHGSVIGVIPGNAILTIHLPADVKVLVTEKENVFSGETEIFSLIEKVEPVKERKSILVEDRPEATGTL